MDDDARLDALGGDGDGSGDDKNNNDDDGEDSDSFPPLEDADIDDLSSSASVVSDSSESLSLDSDDEEGDEDEGGEEKEIQEQHDCQQVSHEDNEDAMMAAIAIGSTTLRDGDDDDDDDLGCGSNNPRALKNAPLLETQQLEREHFEEPLSASDEDLMSTGDHKRRRGTGEHLVPATASVGGRVVDNSGMNGGDTSVDEHIAIIVPLKTGSDHSDYRNNRHADVHRPNRRSGESEDVEDEDDEDHPHGNPQKKKLGRRLSKSKEAALERNAIRRQSSNEMLQAMQQAAREVAMEEEGFAGGVLHPNDKGGIQRRAPPRTKSGNTFGRIRQPPPRTKSGEGGFHRRAPSRTKSGKPTLGTLSSSSSGGDLSIMMNAAKAAHEAETGQEKRNVQPFESAQHKNDETKDSECNDEVSESGDLVVAMADSDNDDHTEMTSSLTAGGRRRARERHGSVDRESALRRNAARRQKSSDMLSVMRDATRRRAPDRSQSSMATFQRRAPNRSISGMANPIREPTDTGAGEVVGPPSRRAPSRNISSSLRPTNPAP